MEENTKWLEEYQRKMVQAEEQERIEVEVDVKLQNLQEKVSKLEGYSTYKGKIIKIRCGHCGGRGWTLDSYSEHIKSVLDCPNCNGLGFINVPDKRKNSKDKIIKLEE